MTAPVDAAPVAQRPLLIVVAVDRPFGARTEEVETRVLDALAEAGMRPLPCDFVPDHDTVADCLGVESDALEILDLNPPRNR